MSENKNALHEVRIISTWKEEKKIQDRMASKHLPLRFQTHLYKCVGCFYALTLKKTSDTRSMLFPDCKAATKAVFLADRLRKQPSH